MNQGLSSGVPEGVIRPLLSAAYTPFACTHVCVFVCGSQGKKSLCTQMGL